jgi:alkylhydroperoxidase family enzyme
MLARFVESRIAAAERVIGVNQDWLRDLYRISPAGFGKLTRFLPLSAHRKAAPRDAMAVARLVGALSEDCGSCVQITVNLALGEGVDPAVLRAVLDDRPRDLAPELADVMDYAKSVAERRDDVLERVETIRARFGETALYELALGIASARLFPVAKRGTGHAVSCSKLTLELPGARDPAPAGPAVAHV